MFDGWKMEVLDRFELSLASQNIELSCRVANIEDGRVWLEMDDGSNLHAVLQPGVSVRISTAGETVAKLGCYTAEVLICGRTKNRFEIAPPKNADQFERRKHKRVVCSVLASFRASKKEGQWAEVGATGETGKMIVCDISPSGAGARSIKPVPRGLQLATDILLPDGPTTFEATVLRCEKMPVDHRVATRIAHRDGTHNLADFPWAIGLRFSGSDMKSANAIDQFIKRQQQTQPKKLRTETDQDRDPNPSG